MATAAASASSSPTSLRAPSVPHPRSPSLSQLNPRTISFPLTNNGSSKRPTPLRPQHSPLPLTVVCSRRGDSRAAVVTKETWEKSILKSDVPVLVEFYASWCGPCRMVHRVIDEIAGEFDGKLKCFVLNTDSDLQIAEDYEIKAVPVVLLFKNGEKRESVVGTMPKEFYIAAIERVLKL